MAIAVYPDGLVPSTATLTLLAANDAVVLPVSGNDWATVQWTVTAAGSGGITVEFTSDAGPTKTNWLTPPMSVLTSTVAANPSTAAWTNATPVAGTYETPIPGDCTAFRVRYQTAGTATTITLIGGKRFVTGVPVAATLFDLTSAVNTAIDTNILSTSGWAGLTVYFSTPAGGSGTIRPVDDAGANPAGAGVTIPASAGIVVELAKGGVGAIGTVGTSGIAGGAWGWKRTQVTSAAVAALTSRVRIEAWR